MSLEGHRLDWVGVGHDFCSMSMHGQIDGKVLEYENGCFPVQNGSNGSKLDNRSCSDGVLSKAE